MRTHEEPLVVVEEKEHRPDEFAFDEMNLVELPFALLTRDTRGIYEIPLSEDGRSRLACLNSSAHGLPNSLAPRVFLALAAMWKSEHDSGLQSFTVKLRELVVRYMYPGRFKKYPPNSELLRSVERQINCIANSRIHTDKWWDHSRKRRIEANVSIISDVRVVEDGGPRDSRTLQVTWGQSFWESVVSRYTKPIDMRVVQRLTHPLDVQLYRLLDRQLAKKSRQPYADVVSLGRFKLAMRGKTLDAGGRRASTYVVKKLGASVRRINGAGYGVRMIIDRGSDPLSVAFERIRNTNATPQEVHDHDLAGEIVREFLFYAHGVPREGKGPRVSEADLAAAREWLEAYGLDKARWMVQRCVKMQKAKGADLILVFRGLGLYESAAAGAYERERAAEASERERSFEEGLDDSWNAYQRKLVELFDEKTNDVERARLEEEAREDVRREKPTAPAFIFDALLRARLSALKRERMSALTESEFRAHTNLQTLRRALVKRHRLDPLSAVPGDEDRGKRRFQAAA